MQEQKIFGCAEICQNEDLRHQRILQGNKALSTLGKDSGLNVLAGNFPFLTTQTKVSSKDSAVLDGDSKEMLSFLWILRSWLLECTAHGVPKVISSANFNRKIFWLIAVFVSSAFFLYQITDMFQDIYSYPITVSVQIRYPDELYMPTVTICNSNKLKYSLVSGYNKDSDLYKTVIFEGLNTMGVNSIEDKLKEKYGSDVNDNLTHDTRSNSSSRCDKSYEVNWADDSSLKKRLSQVQYECEGSGGCIPQIYMRDYYQDCNDNNDEGTALCGSCPRNQFQCDDGECLVPSQRCNGNIDCSDGSDEDEKFCSPTKTEGYFVCCTYNKKIPLENVCDNFDDCARDKTDSHLEACESKIGSLKCMQPLSQSDPPWAVTDFTNINRTNLGDGIEDCLYGIDEVCAWKANLSWIHPLEEEDGYLEFLDNLESNPAATRWYLMATKSQIQKLGHQYEDMVVQCFNNNEPCNRTLNVTDVYSQDYGRCYSFIQNSSVAASGTTYGLQILFNLETFDNLGLFTPNSGLKLYLSPPALTEQLDATFVDWKAEISLAPGFEHAIAVHPRELTKMSHPYSDCQDYKKDELHLFNTKEECQTFCLLRKESELCGCVDDIVYQEASLCTLAEVENRICVDNLKAASSSITECNCPNSCHRINYDVTMTSLHWPTPSSFPRFLATIHEALKSNLSQQFLLDSIEKYRAQESHLDNGAVDSIRKTFGKVNVFFSVLSKTFVDERPVYNIVSVVSNFGGLLGLYLGFSVMTILEVVDFCFDLVEYINLKGKNIRFYKNFLLLRRTMRRNLKEAKARKFDLQG